ncbi:hypothetical protein CPB84DRAFT_1749457 [Gymnopilus junonius]|uniref:Uncharacterized protein n=1 Tax=Gymnopilus junonius TaxID=109634 RepID=A0A9P5NKE2_GYMJU|nr:hypothetical protein CPB84DRAFT_1749457 [Gymnopilus junonius]
MPGSDDDTPALNADGTLKDAGEITWLNSPSDERRNLADDLKKRKRANSSAQESDDSNDDELPKSMLTGFSFKAKSPARKVGGKRVRLLSDKGKAASALLPPKERKFYEGHTFEILQLAKDLV